MNRQVLVAGIGNIFLGDDGFGVAVARHLDGGDLPAGVRVADFGIRGVHLAYELMDGYHTAILVDAAPRGDKPGTLYLIEPDLEDTDQPQSVGDPVMDAHDMTPESVLALVRMLGGRLGRVLVLGCEPASTEERIGLSEPVAHAVNEAVRVVRQLIADAAGSTAVAHGVGEHGDQECGRKL